MKFLVIGDSCIDRFTYGNCDRICPEAPVPVFVPQYTKDNGGMAQNVQANIQALGVECDVITNTGQMSVKERYVDDKTNQLLLRVDECVKITDKFSCNGIDYDEYHTIVVSEYNKGFMSEQDIHSICERHDSVLLDTKRQLQLPLPDNLKYIKLNQHEWELNKHHLWKYPENLVERLIITRGSEGCVFNHKLRPSPKTREVQDLSGAGDTFLAGFAVSRATGDTISRALEFAMECASIVVSKRGVSTVEGSSIKTIKQCIVAGID